MLIVFTCQSESLSDSCPWSLGIVWNSVLSCMCDLICVLNFVFGSVFSVCGSWLYTIVYLKNSDALSCLVFGLYIGWSGWLLRCGLSGTLYIAYKDGGVLVDCSLWM